MVPPVAMASSSGWAWKKVTVAIGGTLPGDSSRSSPEGQLRRLGQRGPRRQRVGSGRPSSACVGGEDPLGTERPDHAVSGAAPTTSIDSRPVALVEHVGPELPRRPPAGKTGHLDRVAGAQSVPRLERIRWSELSRASFAAARPGLARAKTPDAPHPSDPRVVVTSRARSSRTTRSRWKKRNATAITASTSGCIPGVAERLEHVVVAARRANTRDSPARCTRWRSR